jgi:hypothetical protein
MRATTPYVPIRLCRALAILETIAAVAIVSVCVRRDLDLLEPHVKEFESLVGP